MRVTLKQAVFSSSLALALAGAIIAGICSFKAPSVAEAAQCLAANTSESYAANWGAHDARKTPLELSRADLLHCAPSSLLSSKVRETVTSEYKGLIERTVAYKEGVYSTVLDFQAGALDKKGFTNLALVLETAAIIRKSVLACNPSQAGALTQLGDLDVPFTLAVLGEKVNVASQLQAETITSSLFTTIGSRVISEKVIPCGKELDKQYTEQAQVWLSFYQGKHPWVPLCHAVVGVNDVSLVCLPKPGRPFEGLTP